MSTHSDSTRNEAAMRRWIEEVQNNRNADVVDELLDPHFVSHSLWYEPITPADSTGKPEREAFKEALSTSDPNYENLHTTIDQLYSFDDMVVLVSTTTGTRNGKQVSWTGVDINRFVDGKCMENWSSWDRLGLYQQLGVVPSTRELIEQAGIEF